MCSIFAISQKFSKTQKLNDCKNFLFYSSKKVKWEEDDSEFLRKLGILTEKQVLGDIKNCIPVFLFACLRLPGHECVWRLYHIASISLHLDSSLGKDFTLLHSGKICDKIGFISSSIWHKYII